MWQNVSHKIQEISNDLKIYILRNPLRLFLAMLAANITVTLPIQDLPIKVLITVALFFIIEGNLRERYLFALAVFLVPTAVVMQLFGFTTAAHDITVFVLQLGIVILVIATVRTLIRSSRKHLGSVEP
jgi:hypothetical protein